ncbi:hypothetical protein Amsp01_042870 [Amycolatopsis sp. NBRC 101858]|uniref:hypothetical protein n=1 Tax=Amycolatopsis sp. NBRC 101858 TaxID=3032200 RepID=UPI0024A007EA|nr:hypothetical protein [Amycolatopsis sp. NBRC 101858]GLY38263.1 hypothetical protein Amsp01_042870 [Amycolatopsis sp. NBRC 101858]
MAPPFDPKAYEQTVVKPLRGWAGRELPDDLLARYAIDLGMSDHEVERRLREVRSRWNKGLTSPGFAQRVYRAFLRADEALQQEHGGELARIIWWREYAADRKGANRQRIDDLAKTLRQNFGALQLIAPGQLDATVRAAYGSLSPDEVDEALAEADVWRSAPVELPNTSGLIDTTYRHLRDHLIDAGCSSVVELLRGERSLFRLLDGAAAGVTAVAVARAVERENRRAGNQGARQALSILTTAARDGADLGKLALFHLLDDIRRQHGAGVPASALLKQLLETRWEPEEARLAVFSVLNESAGSPMGTLAAVRELLEKGRMVAAQQLVASISGAEDAAAAASLVERQRALVDDLVEGARRALREGAEAEAGHRYRQAVALAADDEGVRAELRRIPPEPALELTAREEGVAVRLSWRPAAGHDDATRYRLVRRDGRVPADADDGVVIPVEAGRTVCADFKAPAGTKLGYAVFAATEGSPWSRPAGTTAEVLPGVADIRLSFADGAVEGGWVVHPDAVAVDVCRGDGDVVRVHDRTRFRDRTAAEGVEHIYSFVARYRRADGGEAQSAPVRVRITAAGRPQPVRVLSMRPAEDGAGPRIRLSWKAQPDAEVVVRRASGPCPWEFGAVVSAADLADYGEEVTGRRDEQDGWQVLTADVPTGSYRYVAFTMTPDGAIRGHDESFGIALPVSGVRHQRFGDDLLLAWEWPEEVGTAEIHWTGARDSGRMLLTRQQYQSSGGCRVPCGSGATTVKVRTKVQTAAGECVSPFVEVVVADRPPTVDYAVEMSRRPLVGGGTVRIRLDADQEIARCAVVVVAAHGPVMPRSPGDGVELFRGERTLRPGHQVELAAQLPRLRKPFWVRCFVETEGVRVTDPSVKQLKVS